MPEPEASPNPVRKPQFATAFRGYDQFEVDEQITKLKHELTFAAQHRDEATTSVAELTKALSFTQKELTDTKAALARLAADPSGPAAMSERVKSMMQLAGEEIAEMREKAEQDAAATRDAADVYADKTRRKAEAVAEQLAKEAEARRLELDKEAEERRIASDKKSADELAAKRSAAERAVAELESSAKERTDAMISDAEARLADAERQQKQAIEFRKAVSERLAASHTALQDAIERLGSMPDAAGLDDNASAAKNGKSKSTRQPVQRDLIEPG